MNDVLKILDDRIPFQAGRNYKISIYNEKEAMSGLVALLGAKMGLENVWSEKIEPDEKWEPGVKYHIKPDYFLFIRQKGKIKKWTIEVKTTWYRDFVGNIIIKAPQVWSCKNNPKEYPNPYVLASTYKEFALIPMGSFWNGLVQDIKFGDFIKKGFLLSAGNYEWNSFLTPLNFKLKDDENIEGWL